MMKGGIRLCPIDGMYNAFLIIKMNVRVVIGSSYAIATSTISTLSIDGKVPEKGVTVAWRPVEDITVVPHPATGIFA
jgi:hypothetical protein